jgi:hypothetical protein
MSGNKNSIDKIFEKLKDAEWPYSDQELDAIRARMRQKRAARKRLFTGMIMLALLLVAVPTGIYQYWNVGQSTVGIMSEESDLPAIESPESEHAVSDNEKIISMPGPEKFLKDRSSGQSDRYATYDENQSEPTDRLIPVQKPGNDKGSSVNTSHAQLAAMPLIDLQAIVSAGMRYTSTPPYLTVDKTGSISHNQFTSWSVSPYYQFTHQYRKQNPVLMPATDRSDEFGKEHEISNFEAGIHVDYRVSRRFFVRSGLIYKSSSLETTGLLENVTETTIMETYKEDSLVFNGQLSLASFIEVEKTRETKHTEHFTSEETLGGTLKKIGVPVHAGYTTGIGRLQLRLSGGPTYWYLAEGHSVHLSEDRRTLYTSRTSDEVHDFRRNNLGAGGSIVLAYRLFPGLYLTGGGKADILYLPFYKNGTSPGLNIQDMGLITGIRWKF